MQVIANETPQKPARAHKGNHGDMQKQVQGFKVQDMKKILSSSSWEFPTICGKHKKKFLFVDSKDEIFLCVNCVLEKANELEKESVFDLADFQHEMKRALLHQQDMIEGFLTEEMNDLLLGLESQFVGIKKKFPFKELLAKLKEDLFCSEIEQSIEKEKKLTEDETVYLNQLSDWLKNSEDLEDDECDDEAEEREKVMKLIEQGFKCQKVGNFVLKMKKTLADVKNNVIEKIRMQMQQSIIQFFESMKNNCISQFNEQTILERSIDSDKILFSIKEKPNLQVKKERKKENPFMKVELGQNIPIVVEISCVRPIFKVDTVSTQTELTGVQETSEVSCQTAPAAITIPPVDTTKLKDFLSKNEKSPTSAHIETLHNLTQKSAKGSNNSSNATPKPSQNLEILTPKASQQPLLSTPRFDFGCKVVQFSQDDFRYKSGFICYSCLISFPSPISFFKIEAQNSSRCRENLCEVTLCTNCFKKKRRNFTEENSNVVHYVDMESCHNTPLSIPKLQIKAFVRCVFSRIVSQKNEKMDQLYARVLMENSINSPVITKTVRKLSNERTILFGLKKRLSSLCEENMNGLMEALQIFKTIGNQKFLVNLFQKKWDEFLQVFHYKSNQTIKELTRLKNFSNLATEISERRVFLAPDTIQELLADVEMIISKYKTKSYKKIVKKIQEIFIYDLIFFNTLPFNHWKLQTSQNSSSLKKFADKENESKMFDQVQEDIEIYFEFMFLELSLAGFTTDKFFDILNKKSNSLHSSHSYFIQSLYFLRDERLEDSFSSLMKASEIDPTNKIVCELLGLFYEGFFSEIPEPSSNQQRLAVSFFKIAAEHPDCSIAANNLAFYYQKVGKFKEAKELFEKATKNNLPMAEYNLGMLFMNHSNSFDDISEETAKRNCVYWFSKSAQHGFPCAFYRLGICLRDGIGCEKNELESQFWFEKAAEFNVQKLTQSES